MSGNAHIWNSIGKVTFESSMMLQLFAPPSKYSPKSVARIIEEPNASVKVSFFPP